MFNVNNLQNLATDLGTQMAEKREAILMDQLNDFVSRGLIKIEAMIPVLIRNNDTASFEMKSAVRLVLKDKEYIIKLEKEIEELKAYKAKVQEILK